MKKTTIKYMQWWGRVAGLSSKDILQCILIVLVCRMEYKVMYTEFNDSFMLSKKSIQSIPSLLQFYPAFAIVLSLKKEELSASSPIYFIDLSLEYNFTIKLIRRNSH
jgi:hypothetical protein